MDQYGADQIVTSQLDAGESLLWSGAPDPRRSALAALPGTLVGIPFAAFAAFWMFTAFSMTSRGAHMPGAWNLFPLFGVPFLLVGIGVMASPLWAWLGASRTVYAVTNRRALIISRAGATSVRSYTHDDIDALSHIERADGSGDLYFASRTLVSSRGYPTQSRIGFVGIKDVRSVEQLIRGHLVEKAA
jgi:hypothetical protein